MVKYNQKLLDHAEQSAIDTLNTASKKAIQKTTEATDDLINKIANKITKASRNLPQNILETVESETEICKERYISPEKRENYLWSKINVIW